MSATASFPGPDTSVVALTGDEPRVTAYTNPFGRRGTSVAGPAGNWLITPNARGGYNLWRSDGGTDGARTSRDPGDLLASALRLAGDTTRRQVVIHDGLILNAWTRTVVPGTGRYPTDDAARAHAQASGWRVLTYWTVT